MCITQNVSISYFFVTYVNTFSIIICNNNIKMNKILCNYLKITIDVTYIKIQLAPVRFILYPMMEK